MSDEQLLPAPRVTHEALWPKDLFTAGIGWVIVARFKSGGRRVEAGIFLVDVFCLGVKLAVYEDTDAETYRRQIRGHYETDFEMEEVAPASARKLVEDALAYARNLGFGPHRDYRLAARVFGGVKAADCRQQFQFGRGGKPFYVRGPRETETQARLIMEHLGRRCGAGNFHYLVADGEDPGEVLFS